MPRRIIYGISLWIFLGAFACTIASIALPNWISYTSPASGGGGDAPIRVTYGLHRRCSTVTGTCTKFPAGSDCRAGAGADGGDRTFCALWRSVGFAMNLSVVLELACVVAYVTVLVGGRATREAGWKVLGALLAVVGVAECVAMGIVAGLYENDNRFFVGWTLDKSWILCTVSWIVLLLNAIGVVSAAWLLPYDDDYEPIPDR